MSWSLRPPLRFGADRVDQIVFRPHTAGWAHQAKPAGMLACICLKRRLAPGCVGAFRLSDPHVLERQDTDDRKAPNDTSAPPQTSLIFLIPPQAVEIFWPWSAPNFAAL